MKCPKCKGSTRVFSSRASGTMTRRRRECEQCSFRYTTMEMPVGFGADVTIQVSTTGIVAGIKQRGK